MSPELRVFVFLYLPWILTAVFGLTWLVFAALAPREVWTAWKIKNLPGVVGFIVYDDAGQGKLKAMRNVADRGIFKCGKREYQIIPTAPAIEEEVPQYTYQIQPDWTEEQIERHKRAVDLANKRLREEAEAKRLLGELVKKRHILFGKPNYIGLETMSMSANPTLLAAMQDAVESVDSPTPIRLLGVDVLKQVLLKAYPSSRIESIGLLHENIVRRKMSRGGEIPIWAVILLVGALALIFLQLAGVVDFQAILGGLQVGGR